MADKKNIYGKLLIIQGRMIVPKSQYNNFGNYNYRNCEDIQEAVKPLLNEVNAVLVVGDELIMISNRIYIKATARLIDCESGESVENVAFAREEETKKGMDASQVTGSTSSYARKYALNGLFCIDDNKDADTPNDGKKDADALKDGKKDNGKEKLLITEVMKKTFEAECERIGKPAAAILKALNVKSLEVMDVGQYDNAMKGFKATPDKPAPPDPATIPPDDAECGLPFNIPER